MAEKRIYIVLKGRVPGRYTSWKDCKEQVDGFSGAEYRGFNSVEEADYYEKFGETPSRQLTPNEIDDAESCKAYVDGSFINDNTGYGYVLITENGEYEEHCGPCKSYGMRQICGEMTATMRAVIGACKKNAVSVVVYYDYEGIEKWVNGSWKTKTPETAMYAKKMRELGQKINIFFKKVEAHTGNEYNEIADKLAKRGAGGEEF